MIFYINLLNFKLKYVCKLIKSGLKLQIEVVD